MNPRQLATLSALGFKVRCTKTEARLFFRGRTWVIALPAAYETALNIAILEIV